MRLSKKPIFSTIKKKKLRDKLRSVLVLKITMSSMRTQKIKNQNHYLSTFSRNSLQVLKKIDKMFKTNENLLLSSKKSKY
jgi:hypothetical protein